MHPGRLLLCQSMWQMSPADMPLCCPDPPRTARHLSRHHPTPRRLSPQPLRHLSHRHRREGPALAAHAMPSPRTASSSIPHAPLSRHGQPAAHELVLRAASGTTEQMAGFERRGQPAARVATLLLMRVEAAAVVAKRAAARRGAGAVAAGAVAGCWIHQGVADTSQRGVQQGSAGPARHHKAARPDCSLLPTCSPPPEPPPPSPLPPPPPPPPPR